MGCWLRWNDGGQTVVQNPFASLGVGSCGLLFFLWLWLLLLLLMLVFLLAGCRVKQMMGLCCPPIQSQPPV